MMNPDDMGQAPMMDPGPDFDDDGGAAPEDQQTLYDWFVTSAMQLMDGEETQIEVLNTLEGGADPVEGVAETAVALTLRVLVAARDSNRDVPFGLTYEAMAEIFEHLVETSEAAGIHDFSDEDMQAGFIRATDGLRIAMTEQGLLDEASVQAEFEDIKAADERGDLDEMIGPMADDMGGDLPMEDEAAMMQPQRRGLMG
jgi:hypothetical protein